MKFCPPHWDTLRDMIIAKGMGGLISQDSSSILSTMMEGLDAEDFPDDPLIAAWFMICGRAVWLRGFDLLWPKPGDGGVEYCPLCEAEEAGLELENQPGTAQRWVDGCTDSILVYCRENNLLPRAQ